MLLSAVKSMSNPARSPAVSSSPLLNLSHPSILGLCDLVPNQVRGKRSRRTVVKQNMHRERQTLD